MNEEKKYNLPAYINIPLFLYKDEKLTRTHLLLAGFIYSLHTAGKIINVKNDYLGEMLSIHSRKVPEALEHLEKCGYLTRIGLGANRKIKWIFNPESSITVQELNNPAPNGILPQTAWLPCPKRHPYIKDNNNQELINNNAREEKIAHQKVEEVIESPSLKTNDGEIMAEWVEGPFTAHQQNKALTISQQINQSGLTTREIFGVTPLDEAKFEFFWSEYPKKQGYDEVKVLWFSQECHKIAEEIIQKLQCLMKECESWSDAKFVITPAKFIKSKRWNDIPVVSKNKSNKKINLDSVLDSTDWINV